MNRKNIWMALFGTVGLFGLNMGFLGVHGGGRADRDCDECSLLGHEAPEESDRRDQKRLTGGSMDNLPCAFIERLSLFKNLA